MEEITIVKRRSRVWPILIALVVLALVAAAVFFFMGSAAPRAGAAAVVDAFSTIGWLSPSSLA